MIKTRATIANKEETKEETKKKLNKEKRLICSSENEVFYSWK